MIALVGVLAGVGLLLLAHGGPAHRSSKSTRPLRPIIQGGAAPTPAPPRAAPALSALQTTEAFAAAYIDFLYGHRPAAAVPYAGGPLRSRLAQLHPQQPGAIADAADPQLTSVHVTATAINAATSTAVIQDGPSLNAIMLRLAKHRGAWTVVDLSESG
jgi:hypothetical protein